MNGFGGVGIEGVDPKEGAFSVFVEQEPVELTGDDTDRLYAAKDMFNVAGRAPTCGLAIPPFPRPTKTATVLRCLDEAGYKRAGFTVMSALAFDPSGCNPNQRSPTNPWGAPYATGGSSSGSAVAVASGIIPLAIGSDSAGSVRIPAACCGIIGWKPAWNCVPAEGAMPLAPNLDTIGLMAADTEKIFRAAPIIADDFPTQISTNGNGFVVIDDALQASHPDVRNLVNIAVAILADELGPERRVPGLEAIEAAGNTALMILNAEASATLGDLTTHGVLDSALSRRIEKGRTISKADVEIAVHRRGSEAERFYSEVMMGASFAVLPVMPICTPTRDKVDPSNARFQPRLLYAMSEYTRFVNYFGWPAVSVPAGQDERGMPVSAQIIGPPGSDRLLLCAAAIIERELPL